MAIGVTLKEKKERRTEQPVAGGILLGRFYEMSKNGTLAGVDMERGDALPDDSIALIQSVKIIEDKNATQKLLQVTAWKPTDYA